MKSERDRSLASRARNPAADEISGVGAAPAVLIEFGDTPSAADLGPVRYAEAVAAALERVQSAPLSGAALLKVHVGEPRCVTRLRPEFVVPGSIAFLKHRGISAVVAGDTTVAYSGPRGHRRNPVGNAGAYLELAAAHGWSAAGPAGVPFVVLDRPCTSRPGLLAFRRSECVRRYADVKRYRDFHLAGGFAAAGIVLNHAHLTLHGLAGLAGCVKGIAMGCSTLTGKLRMHQSLLPRFDANRCIACGRCVRSCPEGALSLDQGDSVPHLDPALCIGCGECEAVCAERAVSLQGEDITDWERGADTLPLRLADYAVGLMRGRWARTIHVLHMTAVTERCDCLDVRQKPMVERDLGVLVGKNPFALDRLAGVLLRARAREEGKALDEAFLQTAARSAAYAQETYGIPAETEVERMTL